MNPYRYLAPLVVVVVVLGSVAGAGATTADLGAVAEIDATPTDWENAESTHAVVVPLGSEAESTGTTWNDIVVHYLEDPAADVSNVQGEEIRTIGIDRGGTLPGTQTDEEVTVSEVTADKDGTRLQVVLQGEKTLREGDEVVVVLHPVQNPQFQGESGSAQVSATVNSQSAADEATDEVTYEYDNATVTFDDQESDDSSVTVQEVELSEGGFVTIQNVSGENPDEIRGSSSYLEAGTHQNVEIQFDEQLAQDQELHATVYLDTDANRAFEYDGGLIDRPYRNQDGNVLAEDSAQVTVSESTPTAAATSTPTTMPDGETPTPTATATPTPTATATSSQETPTPTATAATMPDGETPTPTATPTAGQVEQPGFGISVAIVGILGAALILRRRL